MSGGQTYLVKGFLTRIVTSLGSAGSKPEIRRGSDRCATRQLYTLDCLDFVMEKENPYQATQQRINHLGPPGWAWKIVSLAYRRRKEKQLGHGMELCLK
ncbi:hypothetical protein llap_5769 [Limosa lapponica baueri]|uniref:Uncharacterized protein n=1 Tax=Limosa lapponica baueri TaxID=1758121 RepID=A0A2I0UD17_LIMLA|nr:hypothetical protein llap_5769 [Limosa lapponica baueri]